MFTTKSKAYKVNNKVIAVEYIYDNEEYKIYIPIDNRLKGKMLNIDTYLIDKEGNQIKLNLQPGVNPHITPDMLEAKHISTINNITHKLNTFVADEKLSYV